MLWRMTNKQFNAASREARKDAIRQAFEADRPPGLLAYDAERAVGWCSLAPRAAFPRLETSRILQPVDTEPVWSVSCFFIHRDYRGKGLSVAMLEAGARFVAEQGGQILEGYPVDAGSRKYPGSFAWVGLASAYERAGFTEVARRSPTRPIMRRIVGAS